jgi:hypothetical protein
MVKTVNGKEKRTFQVMMVRGKNTKPDTTLTKMAAEFDLTGSPASAARKAGNKLCRYKKLTGACVWFITVREKTQGSNDTERTYKVIRYKLKEPLVIGEGDSARTIEYDTKVFSTKGSIRASYGKNMTKRTKFTSTKKASTKKVSTKKATKPKRGRKPKKDSNNDK